jgi:hypothetical protein
MAHPLDPPLSVSLVPTADDIDRLHRGAVVSPPLASLAGSGPEILGASGEIGLSIFLYINLLIYVYIVLYKYIVEVSKYMNHLYLYKDDTL